MFFSQSHLPQPFSFYGRKSQIRGDEKIEEKKDPKGKKYGKLFLIISDM